MKIKKLISVLLLFSLLISMFAFSASAATSGSKSSANIYVTTKSNWLKSGSESITLTPIKGQSKQNKYFDGHWSIKVYEYGSGTTKYYTMSSSSVTIKLGRDKNYQITVSPTATYKAVTETYRTSGPLKKYPSWYVSATNKVSSIS